ncbi:MAG: VOC family protein [Rubrivivax sp.]|nr:VOC family protein [Rubrivivax sp.]
MKLAAIRLFVDDLGNAQAFYTDTLGLQRVASDPAHGFAAFKSAGIDLIVETVATDATADDRALVGRFAGVSFAVDDIQTEAARLKAAGVVFTGAPELQFWGGWLATFADPAGNQLQLVQYAAGRP